MRAITYLMPRVMKFVFINSEVKNGNTAGFTRLRNRKKKRQKILIFSVLFLFCFFFHAGNILNIFVTSLIYFLFDLNLNTRKIIGIAISIH